ncbi:unnamed protein product [Symbiodinium sp. CCMP2456]|nr:unnamed protein product [Symbiodinium sp. CCMP2456]
MLSNWWSEIRDLFTFADTSGHDLQGRCACFELRIEGAEIDAGDSVLVRVRVQQQLEGTIDRQGVSVSKACQTGSKAVLRLPYSMWNQVGRHCTTVRALWTQVRVQENVVILDATVGHAFIAGDALLRQQEDVQVAELFCGGFAGWTQAAWSLSDQGVRVRTSWLLDLDDETEAPLKAQMPDLQIATSAREILDMDPADGPILLQANIEHHWWHKIWSVAPPQIIVCSPPCQPWSDAGNGAGLSSADGRLLLLVASILRVVRTPVVCLEEVVGFAKHPDFPMVMQAWHAAGYRRVYETTLQLGEVAPTRRPRRMFIFIHETVEPARAAQFRQTVWQAVRRPSLGGMSAVFPDLPATLRQHCTLNAELLQIYLDPWFLPMGAGTTAADARKYRLCTVAQQAKCFMACYHKQHELPPAMLTRGGLLCSLLDDSGTIRFFASPEIASCHGAQRTQLLLHQDDTTMRILGCSLAVPQAMLTLAHALQLFPQGDKLDPAYAVHHCIQTRLHAGNSALFFLPEGWLLVGRSVLGDWLAHRSLRESLEQGMDQYCPIFHELQVWSQARQGQDPVHLRTVHFSEHIALEALFETLQLEVVSKTEATQAPDCPTSRIQAYVSGLGPVRFDAGPCVRAQCNAPLLLCTPSGMIAVQPLRTDFFHQLKWAFDRNRTATQTAVVCLTCYGAKLAQVADFPQVSFVAGSAADIFYPRPCLDSSHVQACKVEEVPPRLLVKVPEACALDWWVQLPHHLLECLGWMAETDDPTVAPGATMQIALQPALPTPLVTPSGLKLYLRELLFQSQLLSLAKDPRVLLVGPFQVQVDARTIGTDENTALAKTKIASLLLERGVPLDETHATVDKVVPALGTAACLHALRQAGTQAQWQQLTVAANAKGHQLPAGDNRTEKAAQRIQKAVRRQKLDQARPVRAADFSLVPDVWCGIDDQPVAVLDELAADSTGAVLMDAAEANPQDLGLLRNMGSEALCIVVPGHCCPDPDSCSGRTSVPVCNRQTGQRHLLAACYHNVGETDIVPRFQHGTKVDAEETVCCSFSMYQDDFQSDTQWHDFAAAPVRSVIEAFRARGVEDALHHPWARAFRQGGKVSQAHHCDQFVFYAKVPQRQLKPLLQQSGFNRVYVVPRSWDRQLLAGWAVVWLAGSRAEVEKQALIVSEQHGLVRGKNKFGLRVPANAFRKIFTQLRPGAAVPENLEVTETWKVGPFPAAASAEAIREWSKRVDWPTKVIKSLGPQFWLLGSAAAPPDTTMLFNHTPVLATAVRARDTRPPIVQAGGPLPKVTSAPVDSKGEDPWLQGDPWSSYRASQGSAAPRPTPPPARAVPLDSAATARLVQQDSRISELERSLQQMREEQATANHERAKDKAALQHDIQTVHNEVQGLGAGLRQDFQAWTASLNSAKAQQDQQIANGMAELKALILAGTENKKQRVDNDL